MVGTVEAEKGIVGQDEGELNNTGDTSTISYVWQDGNHQRQRTCHMIVHIVGVHQTLILVSNHTSSFVGAVAS